MTILSHAYALSDANTLVSFNPAAPAVGTSIPVTGLMAGQTLVGIDVRPANGGSAPAEWSSWNVSLRLAVAPARPAEPVGVAQPATRRMQARTPLVLVACIRLRRGA
jgi:hypothetical protein